MTARELTMTIVREVLYTTGITATAGIGANLYLAKVAMDIVAKHVPADADGVRIAELDEQAYRRQLWTHEPLTDFWRVGRGYAQKLRSVGLHTMGDIARASFSERTTRSLRECITWAMTASGRCSISASISTSRARSDIDIRAI